MKALHRLTKQIALQQCALVKRGVLQLFNHMHTAVTAHSSAKSPQGQGHGLPLWRHKRQDLALGCEAQCQQLVTLRCCALNVIHHSSAAVTHGTARPVPFAARSVDGFIAFVGIQIPIARPALAGAGHRHFHPRTGCNRSPAVQALWINGSAEVKQTLGMHPDQSFDAVRKRHTHFVDIDQQRLPIPTQLAGSYRELVRIAVTVLPTPLGHGPAFGLSRIKRHIQCTEMVGVCCSTASGPCVIG